MSPRELFAGAEAVVAFDCQGNRVDGSNDGSGSEAILVARPVSDALKVVDGEGMIVGERSRDEMLQLDGFIVATSILGRLDEDVTPDELIQLVEQLGHKWRVSSSFDL